MLAMSVELIRISQLKVCNRDPVDGLHNPVRSWRLQQTGLVVYIDQVS